jgi:hypothetical protein
MAKVTMTGLSAELSEEEIRELEALESREIVYDEDSPQMTEKMLSQFHRFATVPVQISQSNISTVRSFGKNYQSVLTRLLNLALQDTNLIKRVL